jgi:hypothetical protein
MEDGASAEIAVVGKEGVVGIALFLGGQTVLNRPGLEARVSEYYELVRAEFQRLLPDI